MTQITSTISPSLPLTDKTHKSDDYLFKMVCYLLKIVCILVIGTTTSYAHEEDPRSPGVERLIYETKCHRLPNYEHVYEYDLCVFNSIFSHDWFVVSHDGLYSFDPGLTSGGVVYEYELSPDKTKIVIVIGEEGHPSLSYYDISKWDLSKPPRQIWGFGAYPGTIGGAGWVNNKLIVDSDHDLLDDNKKFVGYELDDFLQFVISDDGTITKYVK